MCGVTWTAIDGKARFELPDGAGRASIWFYERGDWKLLRWISSNAQDRKTISETGIEAPKPVEEQFLDLQLVGAEISESSVRAAHPIVGAVVRVIAGDYGTPSWDAPRAVTSADGMVSIGPLFGYREGWCVDVEAIGYCPMRFRAPVFAAGDRSTGPGKRMLYPSKDVSIDVRSNRGPLPVGTLLGVELPSVSPSMPVYRRVGSDGRVRLPQAVGTESVFTIVVPGFEYPIKQVVRTGVTGDFVIELD